MAKKSRRRPLHYAEDQAGCISGLISIFDFRHGRSTRKFLPDRRKGSRQAVGAGSSQIKLPDSNGKCQDTGKDGSDSGMAPIDTIKSSIKKLMEEEMVNEQAPNKQMNGSDVDYPEHGCHTRRNCQHRNPASERSNDIILSDLNATKDLGLEKSCDRVDIQKTSDKIDFEIVMHLLHDHFDMPLYQGSAVDEEKLSATIKIFIDQNSSNSKHSGDDRQVQQPREFIDALDKFSKKDLLLKLLQDPHSILVKQIKALEGSELEKDLHSESLTRSDVSEKRQIHAKTDDLINHKQNRNFFRRRSKSQECFPSMESEKCQSSSKIVILKPGPAALRQENIEIHVSTPMQSHNSGGNKIQGERSQFSFTEIRRKLKHAIRKERQGTSSDRIAHRTPLEQLDFEKGIGGENLGWHSPNRDHFYAERYAKPSIGVKDKICKSDDTDPYALKEASGYAKPGVSNIYLEAKKHLLEMLSSGDDEAESINQQLRKSLGMILSFSGYNSSANCSPRKSVEDKSVTAERSASPRDDIEILNESTDQVVQENLEDHSGTLNYSSEITLSTTHMGLDEKVGSMEESRSFPWVDTHANLEDEAMSSAGDAIISEGATGIEETTKANHEGYEISIAAHESSGFYCMRIGQNGDAPEECHEDGLTQLLEMESFGDCQILSSPSASPPHPSVINKYEDFEGATDRIERPSPVSVLEPPFVEDDISPARTICNPVKVEIQPRQIHFEDWRSSSDQGVTLTSLEDEESAFEYVEAVLLGSGLIWDEYLLRWLCSSPILDSVLYDEVELFSSRSCHEQKLIFDCTNEVLEEVCERYFGYFPSVSRGKHNIRPVPTRMNLIREIWEGVEWHLLQYPSPQSLDRLLNKDMTKSRRWMNFRLDIHHICTEMEEVILDKLVEDTVSNFICDVLEDGSLSCSSGLE